MTNWRRFFSSKRNWIGLIIVALFIFIAIGAPWLAPRPSPDYDFLFKSTGASYDRTPHPPSAENPLGTVPQDMRFLPGWTAAESQSHQWDIYYTLIWGTRSALRFGLIVTGTSTLFGVLVGAVSGYAGGFIEGLLMRFTDSFLTFPLIAGVWLFQQFLFTPVISNIWDPPPALTPLQSFFNNLGITPVMLAFIVFTWMPYARLVNSSVSRLKEAEFVAAAESMGATHTRILFRHLLPNTITPAIVLAARDIGGIVILETAFTFIGVSSATVAWGAILVAGRDYIIGVAGNPFAYWWVFLPISLALILFGIGTNLLGDGLNAALNPRTSR